MSKPPVSRKNLADNRAKQRLSRDQILRFSAGKKIKSYLLRPPLGGRILPDGELPPIGAGGSSKVYLADQTLHNKVSILRAIKLYMFDDKVAELTEHRFHTPVSKDDFLNEVLNMSRFSHENLTKVTDAGIETIQGIDIPYLVSEYVEGPTLQHLCKLELPSLVEAREVLSMNPTRLLEMLIEIGTGLAYLHSQQFAHCDLAPKNVFVRGTDYKPIIGDLGVGRSLQSASGQIFVAGSRAYMPTEAAQYLYKKIDRETFRGLQPHWDLYGFAKTGLFLMEALQPKRNPPWWIPLSRALNDCATRKRYHHADALLDRLKWLLPVHREMGAVPELSSSLSGRMRKLMPVTALVTSRRIRKLIQHPALLRLTKVPQLLLSHTVYPSGNHTRYEHSLGVLETMRQYLVSLLDQEEFLEHLTASKIETALICAALSNVTRFPLYHVVDEVSHALPARFAEFSKEHLLREALSITDTKGRSLINVISENFPSVRIDNVIDILIDRRTSFTDEDHLIHSLLNCSLDARVVDFLRRDSHHLGLAGENFQLDELLPFLTIRNHRLALKALGMSVAEHIISLRYWMFSRVYWSSPNRSFVAMARHLILSLAPRRGFVERLRKTIFHVTEDEMLRFLQKEANRTRDPATKDLGELLCRAPQETFWLVFGASSKESPEFGVIVEKVSKMTLVELENFRVQLTNSLTPILTRTLEKELSIHNGDNVVDEARRLMGTKIPLLLDLPVEPGGGSKLGDDILGIPEMGSPAMLKHLSGIVGGVNDSFVGYLRRFRVMLHPDIAPRDKSDVANVREAITDFLKTSL